MSAPAGSRVAGYLLWTAYASAAAGLLLGFNERSAVAGLRWVTLFTVGVMGVIIFARRVVIAREGMAGDDGPMQIGIAHLAWGLVALLLVQRQSSAPALIAVCLTFALYLAMSAALRLAMLMGGKGGDGGRSEYAGVAILAAIAVAIGWFINAALHAPRPV